MTKVFIGASAMMSNGAVLSRVGTVRVAIGGAKYSAEESFVFARSQYAKKYGVLECATLRASRRTRELYLTFCNRA